MVLMLNLMFVSFNSNTIGVTWGARTANPSGSPQVFSGVHVARSLVFYVVFCRSLFLSVSLFFWSLYCMSFELRFLIASLVSSHISYQSNTNKNVLPILTNSFKCICYQYANGTLWQIGHCQWPIIMYTILISYFPENNLKEDCFY